MSTIVHAVEATATGTLSMVTMAANLMAAKGHDVHVVYSLRPETPADLSSLFHDRVVLHQQKMGGLRGLQSIPALRTLLKALSPDILHLHSSFAGFMGRLATFGTLSDTRVFYSPHCISFMRRDIRARKILYAGLELLASLRPCTYVACSESERRAIWKWLGKDAVLVENAVDVERYASGRRVGETDGLQIVTVGGIRKQKGPEVFARIAERCLRSAPGLKFVWVGDGTAEAKERLGRAGVQVTGWLESGQVADILQSSGVYLSTSLWEGMPVSVIEAMASGVPVLASTCSGNVDIIDHGRTGLLFDSPQHAVSVISKIVAGAIELDGMSRVAKEVVLSRYSVDAYARNLESLYFDL